MHQTKKGNQWHFGMKAHIGVDAEAGLAHSLEATAANAADVSTALAVLHGGEEATRGTRASRNATRTRTPRWTGGRR